MSNNNIVEITGNIFNSKCQTIVNTVNCYGVMGKGLALEFRLRYEQMYFQYKLFCEQGKIKPGILFLYNKSIPWVLNFPTKLHWKDPSKLEYIELGLEILLHTYEKKEIKSIAFPRLGTLNGGLLWGDVKNIMYEYLLRMDKMERIEIYHPSEYIDDLIIKDLERSIEEKGVDAFSKATKVSKAKILFLRELLINEKDFISPARLLSVKGLGERSVEKIIRYIINEKNDMIVSENNSVEQLKLLL